MKIISFNVNGIRAIVKRNFIEDMFKINADIICIQETKAQDDQVAETLEEVFKDYHIYSNSAEKKGYSGTAILSKTKPLSIDYDIKVPEHDKEGRVICVEYDEFFLINVYVPNSGSDLKRLKYRQTWDAAFLIFLKSKEAIKPVIVCGDLNVAHKEIDLARPKENYNKAAGFMQEEIEGLNAYVENGLIDTFRCLHADTIKYTWWSYRGGARERNVGWRIDYFLTSSSLKERINEAEILNQIMGSDHCPVLLNIN